MVRKGLIILILAAFIAGGAFAQDFQTMAKNTVSVDVGPTFVGLGFNAVGNLLPVDDLNGNGFGIGAQFERQLSRNLSAALRFAYLGINMGYSENISGADASLDISLSSFSIEGHARFYPFSETFFLDGMVGYASFSSGFSGEAWVDNRREVIAFDASAGYLKLGAKLGWRITLGSRGGFTIEPSFGYYHGISLGDSVGQQFVDNIDGDSETTEILSFLEQFVFVGGPRFSLNFGWRF